MENEVRGCGLVTRNNYSQSESPPSVCYAEFVRLAVITYSYAVDKRYSIG